LATSFSLVNLLIILGILVLGFAAIAVAVVATVYGARRRLERIKQRDFPE